MLTRPTRHFALYALLLGALCAGLVALQTRGLGWAGAVVLALLGYGVMASGREFFAGRRHLVARRWDEAAACFERFEQQQLASAWRRRIAPLFSGVHTFDGVAMARNNLGVVRLNQGRFGQASAALRSALERDPRYAIAHANLAILAATEGDAARATEAYRQAQALGFRSRGLQAVLRNLLERAGAGKGER